MKPLSGQTALITGAVRRIGRATALELSELGADIVINARSSRDEALAVQQDIQAAGGRAIVCLGDIRDEVFVSQMIDQTIEAFGRLDILVNNAAFQKHADSIEQIDDERLRETWDTNLGGYFRLTRAAHGIVRAIGEHVDLAMVARRLEAVGVAPWVVDFAFLHIDSRDFVSSFDW